jgi:hypothetical protein
VQPTPDGSFTIVSDFNIRIEVSTDNGASWTPPTNGPHRVKLDGPPLNKFPTNTVPPLQWRYTNSPPGFYAFIPPNLILTNVIHYGWTNTFALPPRGGVARTHSFFSTVNGQLSIDRGATFNAFSAPAAATVRVTSRP